MYQCSSGPWYKEHYFEGTIRKVEEIKAELKHIRKEIARKYPDLHKDVKALPENAVG